MNGRNLNERPFISVPGTFGQAWYLRDILVLMVQLSRTDKGDLQRPLPKL